MAEPEPALLLGQFRQALHNCQRLYQSSGQLCAQRHAELIPKSPYLGRRLKCRKCGHRFMADWGTPTELEKGKT